VTLTDGFALKLGRCSTGLPRAVGHCAAHCLSGSLSGIGRTTAARAAPRCRPGKGASDSPSAAQSAGAQR
jgi:hypothetical protein